MIDLRRILVPTDVSEPSAAALRYGTELARRFGARLYLLHVPTKAEARELHPHCAMPNGIPADEIVQYARHHEIDLIVMGTHGCTGLTRAVLGSVAESVVRRAPCPVLTVHHPEHELTSRNRSAAAVPHVEVGELVT